MLQGRLLLNDGGRFESISSLMDAKAKMEKLKVLFLCTGNSCRSQMAEGWAIKLKSDTMAAYSAGIDPHGMNESAVKVMHEAGLLRY